jgi:predicted molibdopterin-dependent oxidoreductase YjgC
VGPDPKETLPVLYLRLRKAVLDKGAKLIVCSPRRLSLDVFATHVIRCEPGAEARAVAGLMRATAQPAAAVNDIGDPLVVAWGPAAPGRDEAPILQAVVQFAQERNAKLLMCPPHAGSQGMLDMGCHPLLDAGHMPAAEPGMGTGEMLEAAAASELDALVIFGADLLSDFPDFALAKRALESGVFTVVIELFATETATHADVVLPSAAYAEREATFTNLERRLQKLEPLLAPPGAALEPWRTCASLARALGEDWGWNSFEDVWSDIRANVRTHSDIEVSHLSQPSPAPHPALESGYASGPDHAPANAVEAGPGGHYPKGFRSGSPFQTGQNWPLSWELRAFEARQRPGVIAPVPASNGGFDGDRPLTARPPEGEGLALYSGRLIYDEGTMVSKSMALRGIARPAFVEMNPEDAAELGLSEGDRAIVTGSDFEAELDVFLSDISRGAVFVPYDQKGLKANRLMSGLDVRVEVRKA